MSNSLAHSQSNLRLFLQIFPASFSSSLLTMSIGVITSVMAAKISVTAMAALALSGSIQWPLISFGNGILSVIMSKMGYAYGKQQYEKIGELHRQSFYHIALVSAFIIAVNLLIAFNLEWLNLEADLIAIVKPFLMLNCITVPFILLTYQFRNINLVIAYTIPNLWLSIIGLLLIVPLNWLFMYGNLPFLPQTPAMAALSNISLNVGYLIFNLIIIKVKYEKYRPLKLFTPLVSKLDWGQFKDTFKAGLPVSVQYYLENGFYSLVALFLASLGTIVIAAHEAGMITYGICYAVSIAASNALTSMASRRLGERRRDQAQAAFRNIALFVFCFNILVGIGLIIFREQVAGIFVRSNPEALELAKNIMIFLAVANCFDSIYACVIGYLVPYRDTKFAMIVSITVSWLVAIPIGYSLAFKDWFGFPAIGIYGFWSVFIASSFTCFSILVLRAKLTWHRKDSKELYQYLDRHDRLEHQN